MIANCLPRLFLGYKPLVNHSSFDQITFPKSFQRFCEEELTVLNYRHYKVSAKHRSLE